MEYWPADYADCADFNIKIKNDLCKSVRSVRVLAHGLHRFKEFKIIEIIKISTDKSVRFAWSIGPQIAQIAQILILRLKTICANP